MFRVFNLRCLWLITLASLVLQGACGRKERRETASTPELSRAPYVPEGWTLDRDWVGSGLKIKDLTP